MVCIYVFFGVCGENLAANFVCECISFFTDFHSKISGGKQGVGVLFNKFYTES